MNPEAIATIASSAAVAGVAGAFIAGMFNRKKLGADATKVITDAASGVVAMLKQDNLEKDQKLDECLRKERALERRVGELETMLQYERSAQQAVNQMHAAWDFLVYEDVKSNGNKSNLPTAPPLYPPASSRIAPRGV